MTELATRWIHFPTLGAMDFQSVAALVAKLGTFRILELALWAFHY
jgi:hypothetical protein